MARYHLFKGTRGYDGHAYQGPSNDGQPAEADILADVRAIYLRLMQRNPGVGWGIYDTVRKKHVPINKILG